MALDPQVRAIVSSGYSNDPIMSNCTEYGFKGVVRKPFKMEDLRDVLQEVLKT
jgi:CheY-like chemotaxis protein